MGSRANNFFKGLRQSYGVERQQNVDTTNEDRVVCIRVHPSKGLARGERDQIQRFKSCVWDTCVDDEPLVSILFPDGKDSTVMTGLLSKFDCTILDPYRGRHWPTRRSTYPCATGRCGAELPLELPLAATLHWDAGLSRKRNWDPRPPWLITTGRQGQSANVQRSELHGSIRETSSNPKLRKGSWAIQSIGRRSRMRHSFGHGCEGTRLSRREAS